MLFKYTKCYLILKITNINIINKIVIIIILILL